jgi:hypothetical protein
MADANPPAANRVKGRRTKEEQYVLDLTVLATSPPQELPPSISCLPQAHGRSPRPGMASRPVNVADRENSPEIAKPEITVATLQANKAKWLLQVAGAPMLGGVPLACAILIAEFVNREHAFRTGKMEAWPSQERMANHLNAHRDSVAKGLRKLEAGGHMLIIPGCGRGHNNRYRLLLRGSKNPRAQSGF